MPKLSVNINKIATLRNARGGNLPNVLKAARDTVNYGAEGITVHPRPDERHITYQDVRDISAANLGVEFNVEGYPNESFMALVKETKPDQVTLVPDPPHVLTSNAGWDTVKNLDFLKEIIAELKSYGCRTSIFMDCNLSLYNAAKETGTDRIELYTEDYASNYHNNKEEAIAQYTAAAKKAEELDLGLNAGHDLNLDNLAYFRNNIPNLLEVSIGHALICDALYYGLDNTVKMYLKQLG